MSVILMVRGMCWAGWNTGQLFCKVVPHLWVN